MHSPCKLVALFCVLLTASSHLFAGNFIASDPELVRVAEEFRARSASFWTGRSLPGDWSRPCPIQLETTALHGGSRTNFQFSNGEVFGWRMTVTGSREEIIENVLPHEVDHMVRASLVRHPIERWLDEGAASLMESPDVHRRLRERASRVPAARINSAFLAARDYPRTPSENDDLYAVGFSLVEFLLSRDSPGALVNFQRSTQPMPARLAEHYQLSIDQLQREWEAWRRTQAGAGFLCAGCGCPIHGRRATPAAQALDERPQLTIWTAPWCGPCRQLKQDLAAVPGFLAAVNRSVQIQWRDTDRERNSAQRLGIQALPTMQLENIRWSGYTTSNEFLAQLRGALAEVSPDSATPSASDPKPPFQERAPDGASPAAPPSLPVLSPHTDTTTQLPNETDSKQGNAGDVEPSAKPPPIETEQLPKSSETSGDQLVTAPRSASWRSILDLLREAGSVLSWSTIAAGALTTGGLGGVGIALGWQLVRRVFRRRISRNPPRQDESEVGPLPAPFPRQLDEARELLAIRQSEGRVAVLDALRGMFLDDECEKAASDPAKAAVVHQLRSAIDQRVQEVAPLSVETGPS